MKIIWFVLYVVVINLFLLWKVERFHYLRRLFSRTQIYNIAFVGTKPYGSDLHIILEYRKAQFLAYIVSF